jgi:hypothetical protein
MLALAAATPHCHGMTSRQPPLLDMTPQGEFRTPSFRLSWPMRIGLVAFGISVFAGLVASAALLVYLAVILVPVAIVAAMIAYAALRLQLWRGRVSTIKRR